MGEVRKVNAFGNVKKIILLMFICGVYCLTGSLIGFASRKGMDVTKMTQEDLFYVFMTGGEELTGVYDGKSDDEKEEMIRYSIWNQKIEISETATSASDFSYEVWSHNPYEGGKDYVCITKYNGTAEVVEIPAVVEGKVVCAIGSDVFADSIYLKKVIIPDSVWSIGRSAFANCKLLEEVKVPLNLCYIDTGAFAGCTALTSFRCEGDQLSIRDIANEAFIGCTALKEVVINTNGFKKVTIGDKAFKQCEVLESFVLDGDNIDEMILRESVFEDCKNLVTVSLPENTVSIGRWGFANCEKLQNIRLDNIKVVPISVFENCKSLTSFHVPSKAIIEGNAFAGCTALKEITFGEGTLGSEEAAPVIERYAFSGTALTEIEIPGYYGGIGERAFMGCPNLTKVVWHNSGKNVLNQYMGDFVFRTTPQLKEVYLPRTIHGMGSWSWEDYGEVTIYAMEGSVPHQFAVEHDLNWENWTE